jgi:hypothetical protein
MGSVLLGAIPSQSPGKLVTDGEGACLSFPYSACGYWAGPYMYYFFGGRLISKEFQFTDLSPKGPTYK